MPNPTSPLTHAAEEDAFKLLIEVATAAEKQQPVNKNTESKSNSMNFASDKLGVLAIAASQQKENKPVRPPLNPASGDANTPVTNSPVAKRARKQEKDEAENIALPNTAEEPRFVYVKTETEPRKIRRTAKDNRIHSPERSQIGADGLINVENKESSNTIRSLFRADAVPDMQIKFDRVEANIKKLISICGLTLDDFKTKAVLEIYKQMNPSLKKEIKVDNVFYKYPAGLSDTVVLKHIGRKILENTSLYMPLSFEHFPENIGKAIYNKLNNYQYWCEFFEPHALKMLENIFCQEPSHYFTQSIFNMKDSESVNKYKSHILFRHISNLNNEIYLQISATAPHIFTLDVSKPKNFTRFSIWDIAELIKKYLYTDLNDFDKLIYPTVLVPNKLLNQPLQPQPYALIPQPPAPAPQHPASVPQYPTHLQPCSEYHRPEPVQPPHASIHAGMFPGASVNTQPKEYTTEQMVSGFAKLTSEIRNRWPEFSLLQQQQLRKLNSEFSHCCNNSAENQAIEENVDRPSLTY